MAVSKVFIVTGASKGIGAAVADYLLKQSHKVVLTARSEDLLESIKKSYPGQVEYVAGDITKAEVGISFQKQCRLIRYIELTSITRFQGS